MHKNPLFQFLVRKLGGSFAVWVYTQLLHSCMFLLNSNYAWQLDNSFFFVFTLFREEGQSGDSKELAQTLRPFRKVTNTIRTRALSKRLSLNSYIWDQLLEEKNIANWAQNCKRNRKKSQVKRKPSYNIWIGNFWKIYTDGPIGQPFIINNQLLNRLSQNYLFFRSTYFWVTSSWHPHVSGFHGTIHWWRRCSCLSAWRLLTSTMHFLKVLPETTVIYERLDFVLCEIKHC